MKRCEIIKDYKDSEDLIHYHDYSVLESKPATCINTGLKEYHCSCGDKYTEDTPTVNHNLTEATCTAPSKCRVCDFIASEALGHDTNSGQCGRCGIYYADDTGTSESINPTTNNTQSSSVVESTEITETLLLNENGIKITALGWTVNKSFSEKYDEIHLELLIENNSGSDLKFWEDDSATSINGYMTEPYLRAEISNGKKAKTTLRFNLSDIRGNGITTITEIEFALRYGSGDYYSQSTPTPIMQLKTSYALE